MEAFRNVEPVLMLGFGLLCAAACLYRPAAGPATRGASAQAPPDTPMMVVVVTGKRLSAAEKRSLAAPGS